MRVIFKKFIVITITINLMPLWAQGEFLIDTTIFYVSNPARYVSPAISFSGADYFVVWCDNHGGSNSIYGARVDNTGEILDSAGIVISVKGSHPDIAFDGTNYLVVWSEGSIFSDGDIAGARITQSGTIIDTNKIVISTDTVPQHAPAVAYDGTNYMVIWGKYSGNYPDLWYSIYAKRVDPQGSVLDTAGIHVGSRSGWFDQKIAFCDSTYLVTSQYEHEQFFYGVLGTRLNLSGEVLDAVPIEISPWIMGMEQLDPDVASDGLNYLVVWELGDSILGKRIDEAGNVLDSLPIYFDPSTGGNPSVAFGDVNYLVVTGGIFGTRVDTSGVLIDSTAIPIFDGGGSPAVAWGDMNYLVAWHYQYDNLTSDIFGARVDSSVVVLDSNGIDIANAANSQGEPSIGFGNNSYLIAWQDYRNESWDIYAAVVDTSGLIEDSCTAVSTAENSQLKSSVCGGYTNYLIVWESFGSDSIWDISGARVDYSGTLLDTSEIPIAVEPHFQRNPAVAFDGTNYLVVWEDSNSYFPDIYGSLVDTSGIVLNEIEVSTASGEQLSPAISFDGTNYFVVWRDARTGWNIYGARVDMSGAVLDTGIAITSAVGYQYAPAVTFDGGNYFVVWEDERNGVNAPDIYGARVDTAGHVIDTAGIAISVAPGRQRFPQVAYDGTNYLVVWQDFQSDTTWDIYGAKVSPSGEIINTYAVCTDIGNQLYPALVHGNNDQILVSYSGWTGSINNRPANTMRIWGELYPFIGIEESPKTWINDAKTGVRVYPNPTQNECTIRYVVRQMTNVRVSMYDVTGRLIKTIVDEIQNPGVRYRTIDSSHFAQGVYFVKITTKDYSSIQKVVFVK